MLFVLRCSKIIKIKYACIVILMGKFATDPIIAHLSLCQPANSIREQAKRNLFVCSNLGIAK